MVTINVRVTIVCDIESRDIDDFTSGEIEMEIDNLDRGFTARWRGHRHSSPTSRYRLSCCSIERASRDVNLSKHNEPSRLYRCRLLTYVYVSPSAPRPTSRPSSVSVRVRRCYRYVSISIRYGQSSLRSRYGDGKLRSYFDPVVKISIMFPLPLVPVEHTSRCCRRDIRVWVLPTVQQLLRLHQQCLRVVSEPSIKPFLHRVPRGHGPDAPSGLGAR